MTAAREQKARGISLAPCGVADEAGASVTDQARAHRELGWGHIELRAVTTTADSGSLLDIGDGAFDEVATAVGGPGLKVACVASAIGNGPLEQSHDRCMMLARRAAERLPRLGGRYVRVMSYRVSEADGPDGRMRENERFTRLRAVASVLADAGVTPLHENCANYAGLGASYTLRLLEAVPRMRLLFDTGNPVRDADWDRPAEPEGLRPRQSAWEFYCAVRDAVVHVRVKDGVPDAEGGVRWMPPGEGDGDVRRILADLKAREYTGAVSIEPHIGGRFRNGTIEGDREAKYRSYIECGDRLNAMLKEIAV
jgi:sugar phosphate isomerase/epimerase